MKSKQYRPKNYEKKVSEREEKIREFSKKESSKKKKRYLFISSGIVIIALFFLWVGVFNRPDPSQLDPFIECLGEKGVKFYGSFQCPHCISQKRMFHNAESLERNVYVECGPLGGPINNECITAGINSYPTWDFPNGERLTGVTQLGIISEKSGCNLDS